MTSKLEIDYAFCSEAGIKDNNDDSCDVCVPDGALLLTKGVAAAIADGVSSSEGGGHASQVCVTGFLTDYYSTPESWTVKTSASKVLGSLNRWLCGQGQSLYDSAMGMVTTFSGMVLKSTTAHIVHIGDSRIYHSQGGNLEQITRDHRVWVSKEREFLSRAMGADPHIDIDYHSITVEPGDLFLFTTDGVHDFMTHQEMVKILRAQDHNLQACANSLVETAMAHGSNDNVSCQLIRVLELPQETEDDILRRVSDLPFPPDLSVGVTIDGYKILRELHASSRSEVFLALDTETKQKVVLKTPSVNFRDDPAFLDNFLHEEWVGRRIKNAHLLRVFEPRRRRFLYNITEYVEGSSLAQWMPDHGQASLSQARNFAQQIIDGLRCMHRMEMFHQDLKPDNILIDPHGILKLIDFGSARIAGREEIETSFDRATPQGTLNYAAPECLRGEPCTHASDIYSLGIIIYELLTGRLPYGETDRPDGKRKYNYIPARTFNKKIPSWVDGALGKSVNPDPRRRYEAMSEFLHDLNHPNDKLIESHQTPWIERSPLSFWKSATLLLLITNLLLLYFLIKQ